MADKRIYDLTEQVTPDVDAFFQVDKSGFTEAEKISADKVFQELSYNSGTKELSISDKNTVTLTTDAIPLQNISGFDVYYSAPTQIIIGAGACKDSTGAVDIAPDQMTKNLTGWSAGSGGGLLDTGSLAANRVYYLYAIYDSTNDTNDFICSLNAELPTLPVVYDYYRKIGMFKTLCSSAALSALTLINWIKYYYLNATSDAGSSVKNNINNFFEILPADYINKYGISKISVSNLYIFASLVCRDYNNKTNIYLDVLAKDYSAIFSEGHMGGFLEVALAANTSYYIYIIMKTNGFTDMIISPDAASSFTLPSEFTYFQVVGYGRTDNSSELMIWQWNNAWEDENFDIASVAKPNSIEADAPTYEDLFGTGIKMSCFSASTEQLVSIGKEYPHKGLVGNKIQFHAHVYPQTTNTGDAIFYVEYYFTKQGVTIPGSVNRIEKTVTMPGTAGEETDVYFEFVEGTDAITGVELAPGVQIHFNFGRDATNGDDDFTGKVAVRTFGFHYLADNYGSELLNMRT